MKYSAYPKYKKSGVEWLDGDGSAGAPQGVPEHWDVKRLKYQVSINDEAYPETMVPDFELVYVDISSVDSVQGITKKEPMIFENAPSRARRIVRDGDTIISTVRTYLRAIAPIEKPENNLTVSTGFAVVRPRFIDKNYLSKMLTSPYFVEEIVSRSVGVSYPAINASDIGLIQVPLPPPTEQQAIATFLDRETGRIDTLIEKKQKFIELLKEKSTVLISRAVTKGLNPKVKMKPSGVEWLGDVPEHWEIKKIKHLAKLISKGTTPSTEGFEIIEDGEIRFIKAENLVGNSLSLTPEFFIDRKTNAALCRSILEENDVLVVIAGATIGKAAVLEKLFLPANTNQAVCFIRLKVKHLSKLFWYYMQSDIIKNLIIINSVQSAQPNISMGLLKELVFSLPPIAEQQAITAYLDHETDKIDTLIAKVEAATEKLKEYRNALISAAVTGKIDVSTGLSTGKREVA